MGLHCEAHEIIENLKPKMEKHIDDYFKNADKSKEIADEVCLYFEWALIAKKVYYK